MRIRSQYTPALILEVQAHDLVAVSTNHYSRLHEGELEILKAQVSRLESIVGNLLQRIAKNGNDAIELAELRYEYQMVQEKRK